MKNKSFGNIYEVESEEGLQFFQFSCKDETQLWGEVIAVFQGVHQNRPGIEEIVDLPVSLFTHTYAIDDANEWIEIGQAPPVDASKALFFGVDGEKEERMPSEGETKHWVQWYTNGPIKRVGSFNKVASGAELGLVFNPGSVRRRIVSGQYGQVFYGHIF